MNSKPNELKTKWIRNEMNLNEMNSKWNKFQIKWIPSEINYELNESETK